MDWMPKPGRALPGIDVPLLDYLPIHSLPFSHSSADRVRTAINVQSRSHKPQASIDAAHSSTVEDYPHWIEGLTTWGETYYKLVVPSAVITNDYDKAFFYQTNHDDAPYSRIEHGAQIWNGFPHRYGMTTSRDNDQLVLNQDPVRFASLLQSWGFFSLIRQVLDTPVGFDSAEWECRQDPSTNNLKVQWPEALLRKLLETPSRHTRERGKRPFIGIVLDMCLLVEESPLATVSPVAKVCLSIRLLCDYLLVSAIDPRRSSSPRKPSEESIEWVFTSRSAVARLASAIQQDLRRCRFLEQRMVGRGWCPSVIKYVMKEPQHGLLLAYYLFTLSTTRNKPEALHTGCNEHVCRAHSVALNQEYKSRHALSDCQCDVVAVDMSKVSEIIAKGGVPLMEISKSLNGLQLSVREAKASDDYTAISHVWADGLGNPAGNALPRCQLAYLEARLQRFPYIALRKARGVLGRKDHAGRILSIVRGRVEFDIGNWQIMIHGKRDQKSKLFWMDTLCIPVGEGDEVMERKKQAIDRMNYIYAEASRVLIVDQELSDFRRLTPSKSLELYARVATSPWIRRSWTFQEAALASALQLDCADSPLNLTIDFDDAWSMMNSSPTPESEDGHSSIQLVSRSAQPTLAETMLEQHLEQMINGALKLYKAPLDEVRAHEDDVMHDRFVTTWNELSRRTTTMAADIPLIFANVLGYSPVKVSENPPDERMQAVIWNVKTLPVGLLYNDGPRINSSLHHHNRWVPSAPSNALIARTKALVGEKHFWPDRMLLHNDSLWLQAESAPSTVLIIFGRDVTRRAEYHIEESGGSHLRITAQQQTNDAFQVPPESRMCILANISSEMFTTSGARLYITDQTISQFVGGTWPGYSSEAVDWLPIGIENFKNKRPLKGAHIRMTAVYDCPVAFSRPSLSAILAAKNSICEKPATILEYPRVAWKLEIKCDPFLHFQPLIPRPTLRGALPIVVSAYGLGSCLLMISFWVVMYYSLRIIIAVQLGWHGTTALYKASLIFFVIWPLPPFPEALFIADRIKQHAVRPIDIAWVAISLSTIAAALILPILSFIIGIVFARKAWSRAHDEDWPASTDTWLYKMTFGYPMRLWRAWQAPERALSKYIKWYHNTDKVWRLIIVPFVAIVVFTTLIYYLHDPFEFVELYLKVREYQHEKETRETSFDGPDGMEEESSPSKRVKLRHDGAGAWKHRYQGNKILCCSRHSCLKRISRRFYRCSVCARFVLCAACFDAAHRCRKNGHWMVRSNNHVQVDKQGWLVSGWNGHVDKDGSVLYVQDYTGVVSKDRPLVDEMRLRTFRALLKVDAGGLCLSTESSGSVVVAWGFSTQ